MYVSIIAALDQAGGIGKGKHLPWKLRDDQKRFKRLTMGHHIIMGRKTHESIGKPLHGRVNIVISRSRTFHCEGCQVSHSISDALSFARQTGEQEVFIIGGAEIYRQTIDLAQRMYLTIVQAATDADIYFPKYDSDNWMEKYSVYQPADNDNQYASIFQYLVRIK